MVVLYLPRKFEEKFRYKLQIRQDRFYVCDRNSLVYIFLISMS